MVREPEAQRDDDDDGEDSSGDREVQGEAPSSTCMGVHAQSSTTYMYMYEEAYAVDTFITHDVICCDYARTERAAGAEVGSW